MTHRLPAAPLYFSIVGLPSPERVSAVFAPFQRSLSRIDPRNDGQMIYADAILPNSSLLAYANADHFAIALPIESALKEARLVGINHNDFPRPAGRGSDSHRPGAAGRKDALGRAYAQAEHFFFVPQGHEQGHHDRPDEQADQAKRFHAAENTEQHREKRQLGRIADDGRPHEMVGDEQHHHARPRNRRSPATLPVDEQQAGDAQERQRRAERDDGQDARADGPQRRPTARRRTAYTIPSKTPSARPTSTRPLTVARIAVGTLAA